MRKQVVVVEDDSSIRELVELILEDHELDVRSFGTATTFLDALTSIRADLYLLDIMLPDGDGIDLCQQIKANQKTRNTPVILMSAHRNSMLGGCNPVTFIAKPFDINDLISNVTKYLA